MAQNRIASERLSLFFSSSGFIAALLFHPAVVNTAGAEPALAAWADSVEDCQNMLRTGKYAECLAATTKAIEEKSYGEEWPILKAQAELALGRYPESLATIAAGIERYNWSVRLRALQYQAALANGQKELAVEATVKTEELASSAAWRYTDADDLVALGEIALALGADAKAVQEGFFERARRNYPNRPDGFVAAARLALAKGDPAFAADLLQKAVTDFADQPDVLYLYSQAIAAANEELSATLLKQVFDLNPTYVPAMLDLAEKQIMGESYSDAETLLQQILSVNPNLPEAHALRAVIFHLQGDAQAEEEARAAGLKFASKNPKVDYLIGLRLSRKYRFREGAAAQRRALEADPDFVDARIQLAQDLLRLGEEAEGWKLAEEAHQKDGYNTTVFNLLQLKDSLDRFTTVTTEHFEIRMEKNEAAVYGARTGELLELAWTELTTRYEFTPETPVFVEIYSRPEDFAVRTFGMPDVAGFLGVCFGRVVTANSPASRKESPTNWESVLWHEFCHVITLQKTANKIPRWLSEGISVYEERSRDGRWGQRMSPTFRDRVVAGNVRPVSELSSAFLKAQSGEDLNFAYYESSMVVEHLVTLHGRPALNAVLADLNNGVQINDALERHAGGLAAFEASFLEYLQKEADSLAPDADLTPLDPMGEPLATVEQAQQYVDAHPNHVGARVTLAGLQKKDGNMTAAEQNLKKAIELFPKDESSVSARTMLADLYRAQKSDQEAVILAEQISITADDLASALRLQELSEEKQDWKTAAELGSYIFGVDPFQPAAVRRSADAAEKLNDTEQTVSWLERLAVLQPDDMPRLNYRIGSVLKTTAPDRARRYVLLALEQAPRYREAHELLLELKK